jgi:hypothetical protein
VADVKKYQPIYPCPCCGAVGTHTRDCVASLEEVQRIWQERYDHECNNAVQRQMAKDIQRGTAYAAGYCTGGLPPAKGNVVTSINVTPAMWGSLKARHNDTIVNAIDHITACEYLPVNSITEPVVDDYTYAKERKEVLLCQETGVDIVYVTKSGKRIKIFSAEDAAGHEDRDLLKDRTSGDDMI